MTDDQRASTARPNHPTDPRGSDGQDPLALFPTESEVAAAHDAKPRITSARAGRRHAGTTVMPGVRRRRRLWLAAVAVVVLVVASGVAAWMTFPGLAAVVRLHLLTGAAPSPTAKLVVETTPPGWDVTEGERRLGATPLSVALPSGTHSLMLRRGTASRPLTVTLPPGAQVEHHLDMADAPVHGALQVTTVPAGAAVNLDGELRGAAPLHFVNLAPGDHTVVVANAYRVVNQRVTITAGETAMLLVPLGQAPPPPSAAPAAPANPVGWVAVTAAIELQVYEGNSLIGSSRNQRIILMPGPHTLRLVNTALGFETTSAVTVEAGAAAPLAVRVPNGSLSVNAVPWAEVELDGAVIGETPVANYAVVPGSHELVLRNPRYAEQRRTVVVSLAAPAHVGVDMRQ
jgi:hypothetical protein